MQKVLDFHRQVRDIGDEGRCRTAEADLALYHRPLSVTVVADSGPPGLVSNQTKGGTT